MGSGPDNSPIANECASRCGCVAWVTGGQQACGVHRKSRRSWGDKPANNDDNPRKLWPRKSSVLASPKTALLIAAFAGGVMLQPSRAQAQWWSRTPVDFEECAASAEQAATVEARKSALSECNAKFAGRRKPGGGYTYFDFMQNRSFDIAGPNPTPAEQKEIDEQYTAYLDSQRRSSIAAAFAAKQEQQQQLQQASFHSDAEKVPMPVEAPNKPVAAANDLKSRVKAENCPRHTFSCEWPRLSESIKDFKKALFGASPSKAKRG
jgi:hypothetical protein